MLMADRQELLQRGGIMIPMLEQKRDRLLETMRSYGSCLVAFSAGVDSTVVAKAAWLALGDRALAVTATSTSLAAGELDQAIELARLIGIRHEIICTDELANPDYVRNAPDRCYHCKTELYDELAPLARRMGLVVIVNGANVDDLGDYRPGMIAAQEHHVRSPLLECGITKDEVRELAALWDLPVWDKPASPCLSSRVAYGDDVTPDRLAMIDRAEQYLRGMGLRTVRVRYHRGELARLEVPAEAIARIAEANVRLGVIDELTRLGFKYITLDLAGFRSGSQNAALPLIQIGNVRGRLVHEYPDPAVVRGSPDPAQ
jgi:pyridinium-3,5-biscarboxylic acid mononucleotide sulfurtransferase